MAENRTFTLIGKFDDLFRTLVDPVDRFFDFEAALVSLVVAKGAVSGIGEPDAAVGMHDGVVRRVERLAVELEDHVAFLEPGLGCRAVSAV